MTNQTLPCTFVHVDKEGWLMGMTHAGSLKAQAEVLATLLAIDVVSVSDVIAWADAIILAEEHPHWSVCELALMGSRYKQDVESALREVPGVVDGAWVREEVLRRLAQCLTEDRTRADSIASALYQLAITDELPDDEVSSLAWWAMDALDLADQRYIAETRDQVIDEMIEILHPFAPQSRR